MMYMCIYICIYIYDLVCHLLYNPLKTLPKKKGTF